MLHGRTRTSRSVRQRAGTFTVGEKSFRNAKPDDALRVGYKIVADLAGKGVVFVTPLAGEEQVKAATNAGFRQTDTLHSVRIEGPDRPGLGTMMARALANAGINLRGLSAAAIGKKFVCHLALDTAEDAEKAVRTVKALS